MSKLIVTVDSASNLPNVDTFGASDPYCIVEIKDGSTGNERQGTVVDVRADDGDSELDYEVDEPDGDFGDPSLEGHHDQHHRRRAGGHHRRRRNVGSAARRKTRSKLSNKPQDFQIRVKVVEARQLQGANISPVCRVTCYNQMKQTRIKKSTNSPYWGETFFFNFHVSPADLMEELVECGVFNSRRLRSDALIGAFKFDLGMLYEEDGHAFLHKWLLLCDPEDPQGGAKGYLKICAVILGPGDEAPSFKQTANADEDEDIEANLLRPAGVQLRPATFTLRVYRAEDLPRMDSEMFQGVKKIFTGTSTKELVDPYLVFQFAGKEVHTDTKYTDDHPEWNEELRIGLQFPSMCERIKLQMDRLTEDDVIGTAYIDISLISAQGESGYLPTFGPAFINFYGSPREFSELGDEFCALNEGKGEGVAYRGRLLAELRTELGETPNQSKGDISEDQLTKVQKFLRRRKFRLHAAFGSATMISEVDAPVEFEISIGNYGNKLDDTPTNAVFDGVHYYFLPWGKTKPCAVVDSQWEDISFRLHAVNFLHKIIQR
uniref:C2 domain-containing protein n=1 Tax=Macrostomum lignano TaxID=282301 RepID=A0A1I8IJ23_9PLAT